MNWVGFDDVWYFAPPTPASAPRLCLTYPCAEFGVVRLDSRDPAVFKFKLSEPSSSVTCGSAAGGDAPLLGSLNLDQSRCPARASRCRLFDA